MAGKKKKRTSFLKKIVLSFLFLLCAGGGGTIFYFYQLIYQPNVTINGKETAYFYIPTGSTFHDVINQLYEKNYIINRNSFEWVAERKNYKNHIYPGRYLLKKNMNNEELIDLLRSGEQSPIKITFTNVRKQEELAGIICGSLEADSSQFLQLLRDNDYLKRFGLNSHNILSMFLPNTYEFYWNTSASGVMDRMAVEYKKFWTQERKEKAKKTGLSQSEVAVLASIVQQETSRLEEKPRVAGVYINRLKKNIPLQADPTLIFAIGDFTIKRVLNVHKNVESPYNTYKYPGLPPGPICLPAISSLEAVLNYEAHDYLYFCAKEDFSGRHNFAKTYSQHLINARKYRKALNKRKIYK